MKLLQRDNPVPHDKKDTGSHAYRPVCFLQLL